MSHNFRIKRGRKAIREFETMKLNAEFNVLKKETTRRKLSTTERKRFVTLARGKLQGKF